MGRFIQTLGIIGFFACLAIMYLTPFGVHGIRKFDPSFKMPDMQFHPSAQQMILEFEKIGKNGRNIYQKYLILDCIFLFCFGILMLTVTSHLFTGLQYQIFVIVCILRGGFDLLENCILIAVLKIPSLPSIPLLQLCSYFTTFKFIMLYIWLVGVVFQLLYFHIIKGLL